MSKPTISAVVICFNEAKHIEACLKSLDFVDEILVLDSGSTDDTVNIARKYTPMVTVTDWPGDGPQRNRGILNAKSDWVLCLDADERVTPELKAEILSTLKDTQMSGFQIPFVSHYLNKPIRFGDWHKEHHMRLMKKEEARYTGAGVYGAQGAHCRPEVDGKIGYLSAPIHHYPFPDLHRMLEKLNQYSQGGAILKLNQCKKSSLKKALLHGLWTFFRGYVLRLGFLDGKEGFILAVSNAEGCYYRYLKLAYLQK